MAIEQNKQVSVFSVDKLITEARQLAAEYRRTTGQVLGISGEIAKHDACQYLYLEPVDEPTGGYDAIDQAGKRFQIKARVIFDESKKNQRIGQLKIDQDWDAVLLVIMNRDYHTDCIYAADREELLAALDEQQASNRAKRGVMSVAKFRNLARMVWNQDEGEVDDEIWDNQS